MLSFTKQIFNIHLSFLKFWKFCNYNSLISFHSLKQNEKNQAQVKFSDLYL